MILRYSYRAGAMRQVRVFVCVLQISLRCGIKIALNLLCYSWCSATSLLGTCALSVIHPSFSGFMWSRHILDWLYTLSMFTGWGKENSWATYFVGVEATNLVPNFFQRSLVSADGSSCFLGGGFKHFLFSPLIWGNDPI